MSRKLTVPIVIGVALLFFGGYGCNKSQDQKKTVLVVVKTLDNPYFQEMVRAINEAVEKSPEIKEVIIRAGASEGDATGQRQILEAIHNDRVRGHSPPQLAGVILTPASSADELVQSLKLYRDAGIPVIIVDTKIEPQALKRANTNITAFIASSNIDGGRLAGDLLRKRLPDGGRILLLNGSDGHETATARRSGFVENMSFEKDKYVLIERTCNWDLSQSRTVVDSLLRNGEKIDGVFAANDEMALGVLEAFRLRKIDAKDVPVIGFDGIAAAKAEVDKGFMLATMMQQPDEMGRDAIACLAALLRGSDYRAEQVIPVKPYSGRRPARP